MVHDREEPDPTLAALSRPGREVVAIVNTRTGGLCGARNTGVLASRGAFVASCDDDDLWYPAKVRLQVERLLVRPRPAGRRLRDPPAHGRARQRRLAGAGARRHPRAAAGEPGQGAAQLDADDAPIRLRRGGAVRRGAAARLRRGLRLAAAGQPGAARSVRSRRSWPTSARTSPPGSATARSTPPPRWSTSSTSIPTSTTAAAGTPGSWARSPTRAPPPASGDVGRGSPAARCAGIRQPRTHGSPSRWPARASSPVACCRCRAGSGGGCREPAAQLPLRRSRQGRLVLAARDAAQAPGRLPDPGEGPLLLRPLLRPRARRGTPRSSATRGDEKVVGEVCQDYLFHPEAADRIHETLGPVRVMVSLRDPVERAWSSYLYMRKHGTRPGHLRRGAAPGVPSSSSTVATPPVSTGSCAHCPREMVHVALFDDLTRDPQGFLDAVTDFLGVDPMPLSTQGPRGPPAGGRGPLGATCASPPDAAPTGSGSTTAPGSSDGSSGPRWCTRPSTVPSTVTRSGPGPTTCGTVRNALAPEIDALERTLGLPLREAWGW